MLDRPTPDLLTQTRGADPWIEVLSGLGEKGPACIRLWTGHQLWLLDVGFGPEPTSPFKIEWLEGADAVFITHDHIDHIGGADHAIRAGLPIYVTEQTARALPAGAEVRLLPEQGQLIIDGIIVTTGRNGHALGGVWLHFALGREALFYSGDWSEESEWFAFDPPPGAGTALIDASYHLDAIQQSERRRALDAALQVLDPATQVLFPVPPSGRAGELALHLMQLGTVTLDDACKAALREGLQSGGVLPTASALASLIAAPFDPSARFLICDTPNADDGMAARIVEEWSNSGRLGHAGVVFFTGHMTPHARSVAENGGYFTRWNVHPPLGDQKRMLDWLGATRFAPLFCTDPAAYRGQSGLPAMIDGRTLL